MVGQLKAGAVGRYGKFRSQHYVPNVKPCRRDSVAADEDALGGCAGITYLVGEEVAVVAADSDALGSGVAVLLNVRVSKMDYGDGLDDQIANVISRERFAVVLGGDGMGKDASETPT